MGSKKKDLEIIYNLQWKNKSGNGGDKANIIGMYDIPATTLNWEIFKSYLLKNSGTVGEGVKVSYITDSNREFPIESQTDFQIALYAFRRKARIGEIVNLKLESNCELQTHKNNRHSNDVETQFDNEANSVVSQCCNSESPPEWFLIHMNKYKKSIVEEVTASVTNLVSNLKPHTVSQPSCYHTRKSKNENSKRRKLPLLNTESSIETTKDLMKSLKLEGKLDHKLEKLESKTKKLKEKKQALLFKSSDSDGGSRCGKLNLHGSEDDFLQMDARPIDTQDVIPHMLGGEIYLHHWKVINSGKMTWNKNTKLMFTWGSKALKPLDTIVTVPYLKSGETGTVAVRLQIPNQPGQYECYFHFHHENRRFGHWLGCQVIVDPFDLKGNKSVLDTCFIKNTEDFSKEVATNPDDVYNISDPITHYGNIWQGTSAAAKAFESVLGTQSPDVVPEHKNDLLDLQSERTTSTVTMDKVVRDINTRVEYIKLEEPTDTNCSSDSDNHSIISLPDSDCSKGIPSEFVVVPDCFNIDEPLKPEIAQQGGVQLMKKGGSVESLDDNNNEDVDEGKENSRCDEAASDVSQKSDMVMVSLPENDENIGDGDKVMSPQKELVEIEEKNPEQVATSAANEEHSILDDKIEKLNKLKHLVGMDDVKFVPSYSNDSNTKENKDNNSPCVIFVNHIPGSDANNTNRTYWETFSTENEQVKKTSVQETSRPIEIPSSSNGNPFVFKNLPHVPNYQQTPPEERKLPNDEEIRARFVNSETEPLVAPQELGEDPINPPSEQPSSSSTRQFSDETTVTSPPVVHILPEALVNGAVNVAKSVLNRFVSQSTQGNWVNGQRVDPTREANLQALAEMGFWNRDLNATLLTRFDEDLSRVVAELVQ
ncbi:next to BRCA1 gene 1 protein-like [Diorhabda carinulata]|uniref:next to BRCA1 gene 1 protein-like n=1 Tax=Diorhabda carinulata TaxID=1163345 RepID=UPI0025A29FA4|nr:next to BRCA1 gene 1 protein-like [Diorhabda carinulata]